MTYLKKTGWVLAIGIALYLVFQFNFIAQGQIKLPPKDYNARLMGATIEEIKKDQDLFRYARNKGGAAFARNCTRCHGSEGQGGQGIPALNDKDWLWGGDFESIYWTITHGIRGEKGMARDSAMPDFSVADILTESQALQLAEFILSLDEDSDFDSKPGEYFSQYCMRCHGEFGGGSRGYGAPSLVDKVWLYGNTAEEIKNQILKPRHGVMPAWEGKLSPETIKALAVYVHSLGGGE